MRCAARPIRSSWSTSRCARIAEANLLFREILTSKSNTEIVLRRMNEAGVLGRFVPGVRPGRVDDAVQHVSSLHGRRASAALHRRCWRRSRSAPIPNTRSPTISCARSIPITATCSTSRCSSTTSPRAASRIIRSPARAIARHMGPRFGFSAADTETMVWLVERHLVMSTIAQSRDLSDRKTIENFSSIVQSLERMKLLTILTTADIRAVGPGRVERMEGAAPARALLRDRAVAHRRLLRGRSLKAAHDGAGRVPRRGQGLAGERDRPIHRVAITRPTGSRSTSRARSRTRSSSAPPKRRARRSPPRCGSILAAASPW